MSIVELSFLLLTHVYFSIRVQLQRLWKLISVICFDIFQLKWYRNALIGEPDDKTNSEKKSLWQTLHVWLKNVKTDQGYQFYLPINIQAHQRVQTVVNREACKPG